MISVCQPLFTIYNRRVFEWNVIVVFKWKMVVVVVGDGGVSTPTPKREIKMLPGCFWKRRFLPQSGDKSSGSEISITQWQSRLVDMLSGKEGVINVCSLVCVNGFWTFSSNSLTDSHLSMLKLTQMNSSSSVCYNSLADFLTCIKSKNIW